MTTVGYGDIYPVTHLGRLTTIFACIWGMFIISMIIVTLTSIITLSNEEEKAYNQLQED
jgi:Ion channel